MSETPEITRTISDQEYLDTGHTIGMHEVLHAVSIVGYVAKRYLQEHPAVQEVPSIKAHIDRICAAIARLYQDVGGWPEFLGTPDVTVENAERIAKAMRETLESSTSNQFIVDREELTGMLRLMEAYILAQSGKPK